eukprot:3538266-Prymnesium_polylepis.1
MLAGGGAGYPMSPQPHRMGAPPPHRTLWMGQRPMGSLRTGSAQYSHVAGGRLGSGGGGDVRSECRMRRTGTTSRSDAERRGACLILCSDCEAAPQGSIVRTPSPMSNRRVFLFERTRCVHWRECKCAAHATDLPFTVPYDFNAYRSKCNGTRLLYHRTTVSAVTH